MNILDSTSAASVEEQSTTATPVVEQQQSSVEKTDASYFGLQLTASELDALLTTLKINAPDLLFSITSQLDTQFDSKTSISYPMSYSQFTLNQVESKFNLKFVQTQIFDYTPLNLIKKEELEDLEHHLEGYHLIGGNSEKSRSEALVFPMLLELVRRNKQYIRLFSGEKFEVDKKNGLTGHFDYLLSKKGLNPLQIKTPVLAIVEAKKADIEENIGQCAAEMYAARLFNQQNKSGLVSIYGAVTTGKAWKFLKLEGDSIFIDKTDYYHSVHLQEIMTILQKIVDEYKATL